jgi:hypothetical protein
MNKKTLALLLATAALCACLLEGGAYLSLRYVFEQPDARLSGDALDHVCHLFDRSSSILPLGVKPHYEQRFRSAEFDTTIRTNNVGFREEHDYAGEAVDIGLVGDSFTFGHGVEFGERYSDLLRRHFPGKTIYSYAYANGYSPPHYYLFLKRNPKLIAKTVVMGLYLGNDLTDDIEDIDFRYDASGELASTASIHYEISDQGAEITRLYGRGRRLFDLLDRFHLGRLVLLAIDRAGPAWQTVHGWIDRRIPALSRFHEGQLDRTSLLGLEYISKLDRHLRSEGSRLVVLLIPEAFAVADYSWCHRVLPYTPELCREVRAKHQPQEALAAWFVEHEIEFVDPTVRFQALEARGTRLYFESDPHWTREGHRAASDILAEYLRAHSGPLHDAER